MVAFQLLICFLFLRHPIISNEVNQDLSILNKIIVLKNVENWKGAIQECDRLFENTLKDTNSTQRFLFQARSLGHKLDCYSALGDWKMYELILHEYEKLVIKKLIESPKDKIAIQYEIRLFLHKITYHLATGSNQEAFNEAKFILERLDQNDELFDNVETPLRRYQAHSFKGDIYLDDNNAEQARIEYTQALKFAIQADEKLFETFRTSWAYTSLVYSKLIALTNKSSHPELAIEYLNENSKLNFKNYKNSRETAILSSLLDMNMDTVIFEKILDKVKHNPTALNNIDINIKIFNYLLKRNSVSIAFQYFNHARDRIKYIKRDKLAFGTKLNMTLAEANMGFMKNDYIALQQGVDTVIAMLGLDREKSTFWTSEPGIRNAALHAIQSTLEWYKKAYQVSCNPYFLDRSIDLADKAIPGIILLRQNLPAGSDRTNLIEGLKSLTEQALNAYYEKCPSFTCTDPINISILFYFEINKSFNLRTSRRFKYYLLDEEKRIEYNKLKSKVDSFNALHASIVSVIDSEAINATSQMFDFQSRYEQVHTDTTTQGLSQIQAQLKRDECIVEYFVGERGIFTLLIRYDAVKIFRNSFTADQYELIKIRQDMNTSLSNLNMDSGFEKSAFELYTLLFKPIEPFLLFHVIIIPDPSLSSISFASLLTDSIRSRNCKNWPFLIKSKLISTQHSIAFWIDNLTQDKLLQNKKYDLIALAPKFGNLKFNHIEARSVCKVANKSKLFVDTAANKRNFVSYAQQTKIIHVSSHAKSDVNTSNKSYILLNADTLFTNDFENEDISANLVFLSACETGIGKVVQAEGTMSLARSFFSAGARAVISTLWKVNDNKTSGQVTKIYNCLVLGQSKDEAIRTMQLDYIKNVAKTSTEAFPFYWAAYQCQGDLSPIQIRKGSQLHSAITMLPLIFFTLLFVTVYFIQPWSTKFE